MPINMCRSLPAHIFFYRMAFNKSVTTLKSNNYNRNYKKRNTQPPKRKNSKHKSSSFLKWLKGIPVWAYWIGGAAVCCVYLAIIYCFFVSPHSFRWKASHKEAIYPVGYNIRGIDISHYQGEIDWEVLRNASLNNDPVRFVFIKSTEGMTLMDEHFNYNFYQAKKNDFIRGTYHFFVPDIDPVKQAQFYLHQVHLEPGDLPPVLDVEHIGKSSTKELQRNVKKWLDIVEKRYGVKPILYTGFKFREKYLSDPLFDQYPFWIAHYHVPELQYKGEWKFWQHTDCGQLDGIKGDVDCNIFNGSLQELTDLTLKE